MLRQEDWPWANRIFYGLAEGKGIKKTEYRESFNGVHIYVYNDGVVCHIDSSGILWFSLPEAVKETRELIRQRFLMDEVASVSGTVKSGSIFVAMKDGSHHFF